MLRDFLICVIQSLLIWSSPAMGSPQCNDFFKFDPDLAPITDMLDSEGVKYTDMVDFIVIHPRGESVLNRLAYFVGQKLGQKLVLLEQKTYAIESELESDDVMVVYWPKLLVLLSRQLKDPNDPRELEQMLYSDFRARRNQVAPLSIH